jgi:anaerobic ribonucleoside-triphosphate reductase
LGVVVAGRVSVERVEERRRERCSALLDRFSTLRDNGGVMGVDQVVKRDGTTVHFDRRRIENAVYAASREVGNGEGRPWAETLSWAVVGLLRERFGKNGHVPHVEEIQDTVEEVLIKSGRPQVAKAYILYRQKRADARTAQEMLLDTE